MRLPNKNDNEILTTIKLSIKMTGKDKMSDYFKKKAGSGENPADAWFYYGLNAWEMMNASTGAQEKHEYLVAALKGFERACLSEEKHWPALLFRPLLRAMMSGDQVDVMCVYLLQDDYTIEEADNDLQKLLEFQKEIKAEPYFFVTYAFKAKRMLDQDKFEEARKYITGGLAHTPPGKIQYLDSLLYIPVIMLYNKLLGLKHMKWVIKVKNRYNILFPTGKIK